MPSRKSKLKIESLTLSDSLYPRLLREIPNPPRIIYYIGQLTDSESPRIAIVGTRKASTAGRLLARKIAADLAARGIVIVSGLAMGIDTAAHEGAVASHSKSIAVLGSGIDFIYPRQNENLAQKILDYGGAIVSEYPPGTSVLPHQFLERNRIISGLCVATVVIEAPFDSGALVTARLAAEQGREVFVFPGPVNHPNYRGSHKLIRDGACLVSSIEDILEDLNLKLPNDKIPAYGDVSAGRQIPNPQLRSINDENQAIILRAVEEAGEPMNIDKIIELTKLEPRVVSQALTLLIINNFVKETERGYTI